MLASWLLWVMLAWMQSIGLAIAHVEHVVEFGQNKNVSPISKGQERPDPSLGQPGNPKGEGAKKRL
jgi:hypothetical protein